MISGLGRSLGEGNGTHSSILAWRIPWPEEPGGLQASGRVEQTEQLTLSVFVFFCFFFVFFPFKSFGRFNIISFANKFQDNNYVFNYSVISLTLFPMVTIIYELDSR